MFNTLQRHPVAMTAELRESLALTFALPEAALQDWVAPGLELDSFRGCGFIVIGLVQARGLRPVGFPLWIGLDCFLAGFRVFVRTRAMDGMVRRGLRVIRSASDSAAVVGLGNVLTRYGYECVRADWRVEGEGIDIRMRDRAGRSLLELTAVGRVEDRVRCINVQALADELPVASEVAGRVEDRGRCVSGQALADELPVASVAAGRVEGRGRCMSGQALADELPVASEAAGRAEGRGRCINVQALAGELPVASLGSAARWLGDPGGRWAMLDPRGFTEPFGDEREALRYTGPMPFTFSYELGTGGVVSVRGLREHWRPRPTAVTVRRCAFIEDEPRWRDCASLVGAFFHERTPYLWERGRFHQLAEGCP